MPVAVAHGEGSGPVHADWSARVARRAQSADRPLWVVLVLVATASVLQVLALGELDQVAPTVDFNSAREHAQLLDHDHLLQGSIVLVMLCAGATVGVGRWLAALRSQSGQVPAAVIAWVTALVAYAVAWAATAPGRSRRPATPTSSAWRRS